jgi:hypothetical protein
LGYGGGDERPDILDNLDDGFGAQPVADSVVTDVYPPRW